MISLIRSISILFLLFALSGCLGSKKVGERYAAQNLFQSDEEENNSDEDSVSEDELLANLRRYDLGKNKEYVPSVAENIELEFPLPNTPASPFSVDKTFRSIFDAVLWPVNGRVSSFYGPRGRRFHKGIDIAAPRGTPIKSSAPGQVIFTGTVRGYGRTVIVQHDGGYRTLYAHCHRIKTKDLRLVKVGEILATVGATGRAFGTHLHFEIRNHANNAIDPIKKLKSKAELYSSL